MAAGVRSASTSAPPPIRDGNVLLMSRLRLLFTEVLNAASAWRERRNALLMIASLSCAGVNELLMLARPRDAVHHASACGSAGTESRAELISIPGSSDRTEQNPGRLGGQDLVENTRESV